MEQLTGIDTSFLTMETGGQFGHVGSLCVYDPAGLGERSMFDALEQTMRERLHRMPPYRRRLVEVPFGLDRPYWIEDPAFDLDYHLRHIAVPPPGDEQQLSALVSRLHGRPLDRTRPLWEMYVIEGLADGLVAIYTKVHHATIDGVSGAELLQVMLDRTPEGDPVPPPEEAIPTERVPSNAEMLARGVTGLALQPGRIARTVFRTVRDLAQNNGALAAVLGSARVELPRLPRFSSAPPDAPRVPQTPAPRTRFNGSITPHRRLAYFSLPLDTVKHVKKAFGTTLNDVVMAVSSGALRAYLLEKSALPADPLIAMVPVSVRTESESQTYSNRVSSVLAELATDEADPLARLQRIHVAMAEAKRMQQAVPANLLQDWSQVPTPALAALAARTVARTHVMDRVRPPFNVVISNVPGPREPLYCSGAELRTYYPVSAVAEGQGLNITVQSYRDHLDFGLIACRELVPDVWRFRELFGDALRELEKAASDV